MGRSTRGEPPPPLNRLAVAIKVLRLYIFAMLFAALKYMACKLLTDTAIKTVSNNYSCQVPLDTTIKLQCIVTRTCAKKFQYYGISRCRRIDKLSVKASIFGKSPSFTRKNASLKIPIYWNFALPLMGSFRKTGQTIKSKVSTKVDRQ